MEDTNSPLNNTYNKVLSKKFPAKEKHPSISLLTIIVKLIRTDTRLNEQLIEQLDEQLHGQLEVRIKSTLTLQFDQYYERSDLLILKLNILEGYYVVNMTTLKWSYYSKKKSAKAVERLVYKGLLPEGMNELFLRKLCNILNEGILLEKVQRQLKRYNSGLKRNQ